MKYNGRDKFGANEQTVVIPRADGNVIFRAVAVTDFTEVEALLSRPKPRKKTFPGKEPIDDLRNPDYLRELENYNDRMNRWIELKSLQATKDLTWDTVDMTKPETWGNWIKELRDAGFLVPEINKIVEIINKANGFDDNVYREATESFLAMQSQASQ